MREDLRILLATEADRRVDGTGIPPVADLRGRSGRRARGGRRKVVWLAPGLAAAGVIAVAVFAAQVPGWRHVDGQAAAIPPAPKLEPVVPPLVVRQHLGAPPGHLNGPPVATAETLAVSPAALQGERLRTVAVITPHTPDGHGNPRLNRCVYTYSEPAADDLHGRCDWAQPAALRPTDEPMTLEIQGAPGRTWLQGTAPVGTAAVLVRSPGSKQVTVAVGDPGQAWSRRPFYVIRHARAATDLFAVDRTGRVLARQHLPSDVATRRSSNDPELGTVETPMGLAEQYSGSHALSALPARADVLARYRVSDTVTLLRYGLISGTNHCVVDVVRDYGPDAQPGGGGGGCGPGLGTQGAPIEAGRSFSAGTGAPQEQLLSGSALPGTVRLRLSAAGRVTVEVRAYDAGPRWNHRAYFIAPWPSEPATRIAALGQNGQQLAATVTRGLNPRAFDAEFLAAEASCMEHHGIEVIRTPQGHGIPPAYEFRPGTLAPAQLTAMQNACEDEASRLTS